MTRLISAASGFLLCLYCGGWLVDSWQWPGDIFVFVNLVAFPLFELGLALTFYSFRLEK